MKKILIKHSVNLKNHINKSKNVRLPKRAMYNSIVYFKIEHGDSGFSCDEWIRRLLNTMPQ